MADDEIQERPGPKPPEFPPRRVIALKDLAGRANTDGKAAADNQSKLALMDGPSQIAMGFVTIGQQVSAALYYCALAICERIDSRDAPALIEEIDKNAEQRDGRPN